MLYPRFFNFIVAFFAIVILSPLFILVSIFIKLDSKGKIFYRQERMGLNFMPFKIFKFRTMFENSDAKGLLTTSHQDKRITNVGLKLRKYKLDELPQLINVLNGTMNIVGPRPEVEKYVNYYNEEQKKVLTVKPGITDYASIEFSNENEILAQFEEPEKAYIEQILPKKLELNLQYIKEKSFLTDILIIFKTIIKIF